LEEFLHIIVRRKCFLTGKYIPTGKRFPARKHFPTGKCFTDGKPYVGFRAPFLERVFAFKYDRSGKVYASFVKYSPLAWTKLILPLSAPSENLSSAGSQLEDGPQSGMIIMVSTLPTTPH
jgi:hypothetical protein